MCQDFGQAISRLRQKYRHLDQLTIEKHHFLAELQEPSRWRTQRSKNHE